MITNYFTTKEPKINIVTNEYEIQYGAIPTKQFKSLLKEIGEKACVCVNDDRISPSQLHHRCITNRTTILRWSETLLKIRDTFTIPIDYAFVQYYSQKQSLRHYQKIITDSSCFICIGGSCTFTLEHNETKVENQYTLCDGDMLLFKPGFNETYSFDIRSRTSTPHYKIVFRAIQIPNRYFIYFPAEKVIRLVRVEPESYHQLTILPTHEPTVLGIVANGNSPEFQNIVEKDEIVGLLKSNLQKAVRRQLKEIALRTTMELIVTGNALQLLRRLTIISIEDLQINQYYAIIVWYYLAVMYQYKLTEWDVSFIVSYVSLLCDIDVFFRYDNHEFHMKKHFKEWILKNEICYSLFLRGQYGGFQGELDLMDKLCYLMVVNKLTPCVNEMEMIPYPMYTTPVVFLSCSIDFHCFQKMPEKMLTKMKIMYPQTELTEKRIKEYIWHFDSHVNARIEHVNLKLNREVWEKMVRPFCENYRFHIMRMQNLGDLV